MNEDLLNQPIYQLMWNSAASPWLIGNFPHSKTQVPNGIQIAIPTLNPESTLYIIYTGQCHFQTAELLL